MDHVGKNPWAQQAEYLLFRTGWGQYWGKPEYFGDYPCVTPEVVDFMIATNKTVIIENLNNLDKAPEGLFTFCALPLRYEKADGSPIRAVALLEI